MEELIYKSQAIEAIGEKPLVWNGDDDELANLTRWRHDYEAIMAIPSVQTIVNCDNCANWDRSLDYGQGRYHYCPMIDLFTDEDFFCKFGGREDVG